MIDKLLGRNCISQALTHYPNTKSYAGSENLFTLNVHIDASALKD